MSDERVVIAGIAALFFGFYIASQQQYHGALPAGIALMGIGFYFILKNVS